MRKKTFSLLIMSMVFVLFASCEKKIEKTKSSQPAKEKSICDSVKVVSIKDIFCVDSIYDYVLTEYYYMIADGTKCPIYQSRDGKCFIFRTSAKTGKTYKQYLPEVDEQLIRK